MKSLSSTALSAILVFCLAALWQNTEAQDLPRRYATLELFTNTPCPICASQNPGFFDRLENYEGLYHQVSFYPGKPYASCIFYQANIPENTARLDFYPEVFGTPRVAINGTQFMSSGSVSNTVLDNITGGESWLEVHVEETTGISRDVNITLTDHVGGSLTAGKLFAVIVEREIMYQAPNGETVHYNVFRKFLTSTAGDDIDLSAGTATANYEYDVDAAWQAHEIYVVAWLMNPESKEIYNSGTRFDPDFTSSVKDSQKQIPLKLYPNPVSHMVWIDLPENADAPLHVFNAHGQLVHVQQATGGRISISTSAWPAGTYQVEMKTDQNVWSGRFEVVR